ncbi:hypothetical protein [Streptomyces griseofuscus]|uniref:Uncharacterized protein n=1 Tax=Streptomyces griseofuscus TaxID=146922 RepID=A0A3R8QC81_9ACTN|nr:hypothetical protein [Streptomyces griseofuscus]RRQ81544.1 hypothetical protein CQW44_30550 [Streptomyces griseofuscus]
MGKTWQPQDHKKFAREAKLGKTYYYIVNLSPRAGAWEDKQLYSEVVFDGHAAFTGTPTANGYSAATLCLQYGPIYEDQPRGIRNAAVAAPQVAGPLSQGYEGVLDHAEIRGLEKQVADSSDPRTRRRFL